MPQSLPKLIDLKSPGFWTFSYDFVLENKLGAEGKYRVTYSSITSFPKKKQNGKILWKFFSVFIKARNVFDILSAAIEIHR